MVKSHHTVRRCVLLTVAAVLLVAGDAHASLWQTRSEVDAAYGRPVRRCEDPPGYVFWLYRVGHMDVLVTFVGARSHREIFYRSRAE